MSNSSRSPAISPAWWLLTLLLGVGCALIIFDQFTAFYADRAWFDSLGFASALWTAVRSRWAIGAIAFWVGYGLLWINIRHAWRNPPILGLQLIFLSISGSFAWILMRRWLVIMTWIYRRSVGIEDPIFHQDLSFYIFSLPYWELLQRWSFNLLCLILFIVGVIYLTEIGLAKQRLTLALTITAQRHLLLLGGSLLGIQAWGHWLSRYELLYSTRGTVFGAGYTDVHAQLPANTALAAIAAMTAVAFIWITVRQTRTSFLTVKRGPWLWSVVVPLALLGAYFLCQLLIGQVYPDIVQALVVTPNGLKREYPYIEYNIQFTRQGFDLNNIEVRSFQDQDQPSLTFEDLINNAETIKNIRLWDPDPLLATYRQLQEIRSYYQFPDVDVDRYNIGGELRQVMHSARELDYSRVPPEAQKWDNEHFFYTHGYGVTLSPVNVVRPRGLPDFYIFDIPPRAQNDAIEAAIPLEQHSIYYGELTTTKVITGTKARELHYPKPNGGYVYNRYFGTGGITLPALWQRFVLAWHFRDPRILISQSLEPDSKLLFRRQILERVKHITPFLRYDRDPYMVMVAGRMYWVLDAYTTSDRYPYSEIGTDPYPFNYIRNSVKAVVDAYDGSVDFYIARPDDPLIQTYQHLFPALFKPMEAMPAPLQNHIRYPLDLFQVQAEQFATYHMTEPRIFYNREDQWQLSLQVRDETLQQMEPQYLILKLQDAEAAEFVLFSSFTPIRKQNLIAWMAARCDGEHYGKLIVYEFPKGQLIFGPQQVEARINQNPEISERISLWNEHGSRVNQGHLLVIPIKNSLLYVQSLFLESEDSRLPQLTRVIAAYEDHVVMASTLTAALEALFEPEQSSALYRLEPDLLQQALDQWQQAEQARQTQDWTTYNQLNQQLRSILEQLQETSDR